MIPAEIVDEVRARADIVELIGEHVPLKRAGKDFRGLCPFHREKTPSFYVVPAKGFFNCFGCHESGDLFAFLMKHLGLGFQDAVRQVAERVGVEIPDTASGRAAEDPNRQLYEVLAFAADFYVQRLRDERLGARARRYLEERGVGRDAIERFGLGYAPDEWGALLDAARRHGIPDSLLLEAGLAKVGERSDEPYDRLRDRVVFPITDTGGRVIAFGGRILRARERAAKYLNSPETPIYHKGRNLYGLAWAKAAIRREGAALVVEGYMDYVSLAARGIENVVAGLGTAITAEQAALVRRYARQALLLYDSDAAGLRATFRTGDALLGAGVHPLVVTLPPGSDPDSVVRDGGAAALRPYLDAAVDVLDRKLGILEHRGYFQGADGRRKALDGLLPTLRAAVDPALRDIYVARVAERTGVTRETLEAELRAEVRPVSPPVRRAAPAVRRSKPSGLAGQRTLILLLLRDEARIAAAADALEPEEFGDAVYRELFRELVAKGGLHGRGAMGLELSDAARARLEELLGDPEQLGDADGTFDATIRDIREEGLFRRLDEIEERLRRAHADGDDAAAASLLRERTDLTHTLRKMGYTLERLFRKRGRSARNEPSTSWE